MSDDEDVRRRLADALAGSEWQMTAYTARSRRMIQRVAVHEAGHAVVGALNGERIGDIVLCPPLEGETDWGGLTVREAGSANVSEQVQAALAGDAAEGSRDYARDRQKAMDVLGATSVDEADVPEHLSRGWQMAQELVAEHRDAVDRLAALIGEGAEPGEHRRMTGQNVRALLGELLGRTVDAPVGGDSEPCDCANVRTSD